MPIKGLTDRRSLPRLEKLHLGIKRRKIVNGGHEVEFPVAVDYFVIPEDSKYRDEFIAVFGEKPKELRILIPVEDEEKWASQYYRAFSKTRGLICKGDGESADRLIDMDTGTLATHESKRVTRKIIACPGRECPDYERSCREIMNLQFMIPEIRDIGVWQIDTSSINSIKNINSTADLIKRLYGRIRLVPLLLTIEPQEVQDPEGHRRIVHTLHLRTNTTLVELMQAVLKPVPEMLGIGDEMPEPDDEVPDYIIPENQEEAVTAEAMKQSVQTTEPPKEKKKKPANKKETPPETETAPPAAGDDDDPDATHDEKKEIIELLSAMGLDQAGIVEKIRAITGLKAGEKLRKSHIVKIKQKLGKPEKTGDQLAEELLKEFG